MNVLVGLVSSLLLMGLSSASKESCPEFCYEIYRPVCGSDGKTYGNDCELRSASCRTSSERITIAHEGECRESCPDFCHEIYRPVCGSDGKTYGNECELRSASCSSSFDLRRITIAHPGECKKECPNICPLHYDPVCGSDGKTYGNGCQMDVATCQSGGKITQVHPGPCAPVKTECRAASCATVRCGSGEECKVIQPQCFTTPCCEQAVCRPIKQEVCHQVSCDEVNCPPDLTCKIEQPACKKAGPPCCPKFSCIKRECPTICPLHYDPVCGSDGKTYGNGCQMGVATCLSDGKITEAHPGPCAPVKTKECPTICTQQYDPVCGSDGKTYGNGCQMGVATCLSDGKITEAHPGPCAPVKTNDCGRQCNKVHKPVCGSDGVTYSNKCLLEIAKCETKTNITITSYGTCEDSQCGTATCATVRCGFGKQCDMVQPHCVRAPCCKIPTCTDKKDNCNRRCNKIYRPLCGSDGVTYNNQCFLDLAKCESGKDITIAHKGKCGDSECKEEVSCSRVRCGSGEECAVIQPQCFTTPCCKQAVCRPRPRNEFIWA